MRKLITICAVVVMILALSGVGQASWSGTATIRDESFYVPSTGLTLGDWTTVYENVSGYAITENFQINMEYQAGILDSDIANINTYLYPANAAFPPGHSDGTWALNFSDPECYVFNVSLTGGLTIYEYDGLAETVGGSDIKWTLTAWHQTILAGDIVGNELVVVPTGTYRPFIADPPVNNAEVFDGSLNTEVLGYTFTGVAGDIGSGDVLGVVLVPEPTTMCLLGLGGLMLRRRRSL
jgi:PEP-CTERM motif-containing protein